ncbi:metallophosphoesterase family protein [Tautonia rosea]|uniref:metallophosphoesterase family protein n=1 Tax=Tautonia rosea TaxID=2728037 RepID=UPI0014746C32|nr:metallophosphoesterase [Tautonia rosea]
MLISRARGDSAESVATGMTRRGVFRAAAGAAGGAVLLGSAAEAATPKGRRVLRLAHLTDIHITPERNAEAGFAACLEHVQGLDDAPELILFGGDCIMDAFAQDPETVSKQWNLWHRRLEQDCSLPVESCIGNHDVWGWRGGGFEPSTDGSCPGKRSAVEELGLPGRYRAFEKAGWKFVVLDSTYPGAEPGTYTAKIDEEQFDWLVKELEATPASTPILVLSHIPIMAACPFLDGDNEQSGNWQVPGAWMHIDARRLTALFHERGNVRACLSGHIHLADRVDYLGTTYSCNGAVCGGWWKGPYQQFGPAYAVVELYDDGSSECRMISYGWDSQG